MRRSTGIAHRGFVTAVAVLVTVLAAAGCSADSDASGSGGKGSAHTTDPGGDGPSKAAGSTPTWEFEHIADFHGKLSDVAALAADDIWAVATETSGASSVYMLHYDGERWAREPLPVDLPASASPPTLEEIGTEALWLRPLTTGDGTAQDAWAKWDGTRWSAVPDPPRGNVGELEADAPDDIWTLSGEQTAEHWDGTRWTTTRLPYRAADIAVVGTDDVWAVGSRATGPGTELSYGERYSQPASMHWDGTSWRAVDTPEARFDPLPAEPSAGLGQVFVSDDGTVRAYGSNTFNHGEVEVEPADEFIQLRWDGAKWVDEEPAPGGCADRRPVARDGKSLFLEGNWYLADDGRCVKIGRHRLPVSTGARKESHQSLWLEEIHPVPGTDAWLGAGHVQVNQSGSPFDAPVVVRLERRS